MFSDVALAFEPETESAPSLRSSILCSAANETRDGRHKIVPLFSFQMFAWRAASILSASALKPALVG